MSIAQQSTEPVSGPGIVIAVDGTSGSGKSSTSRGVAIRLGARYLDTGAMFRAITWWMLQHGVDVKDAAAVAARAPEAQIVSGTDPQGPTITLDGRDVATEIRSDEVNAAVSPVSAVPEVRRQLLELQRTLIADAKQGAGIVVEGRDIASVVWPEAELKIHLSADAATRAERRALEQGSRDAERIAATRDSLQARDAIDSSRESAPLRVVDQAVHIDTTGHTLAEVIDEVVALARPTGTGTSATPGVSS